MHEKGITERGAGAQGETGYALYAGIRARAIAEFLDWAEHRGARLMWVDDSKPYGANWLDLATEWINEDELASDADKQAALAKLQAEVNRA